MRIAVATLLTIAVLATMAERTFASEYATSQDVAISDQQQEVDDNDDTRVEVQLVVLGIVIGTVFVFGSVLYLVRRRLGLVPPPPEPAVDAHH